MCMTGVVCGGCAARAGGIGDRLGGFVFLPQRGHPQLVQVRCANAVYGWMRRAKGRNSVSSFFGFGDIVRHCTRYSVLSLECFLVVVVVVVVEDRNSLLLGVLLGCGSHI